MPTRSPQRTPDLRQEFDQAFRRPISLKPSDAAPGTIYHYTQATGFVGVLEEASLWLTNFSFLNDSREIEHGRELVLEVLEDETKSHGDEQKDFLQRLKASFNKQAVSEVYVGCLTESRDDLSQ